MPRYDVSTGVGVPPSDGGDEFMMVIVAVLVCALVFFLWSKRGGGGAGNTGRSGRRTSNTFFKIGDHFETLDAVTAALRRAGLESSNLIVGVDFTKSNEWTGKRTFGGRCLHHLFAGGGAQMNPYERAIDVIGRALAPFDDDDLIPVYGFGDGRTNDRKPVAVPRNT